MDMKGPFALQIQQIDLDFKKPTYPTSLSLIKAVSKSLDIVRPEEELFKDDDEFAFKNQIACLVGYYMFNDPDTNLALLLAKEPDRVILKADIKHLLHIVATKGTALKRNDPWYVCTQPIIKKYGIDLKGVPTVYTTTFNIFVEEMFEEVKQERSGRNLNREFKFFEESPIYKNLKAEYGIPGILALLPAGEKYGGFVKAYLHVNYLFRLRGFKISFPALVGIYRAWYNAKIYTQEERLDFFSKMPITDKDCLKWSFIFDSKMAKYKNIHKIFGQVA